MIGGPDSLPRPLASLEVIDRLDGVLTSPRLFDSAPLITPVLASKLLLILEKSFKSEYFRLKPEMIG